jgi:bifunctional ADP-heptose synthase (sugar kinase/adenylyltransferase)
MFPEPLEKARAEKILERARDLTVVVTGDVCLDAYWSVDMRLSELSRETPHYSQPVVDERYSPGGGGNVAVSLKTLGIGNVRVATVFGDDWRGRLLTDILSKMGIDCSKTFLSPAWTTTAFIKPMLRGFEEQTMQEAARFDFVNEADSNEALLNEWLPQLEEAVKGAGAVIVMDQVAPNLVTKSAAQRIVKLSQGHKETTFLVDSRYKTEAFAGLWLKGNDREVTNAAKALGAESKDPLTAVSALAKAAKSPVTMTAGEAGAVVVAGPDAKPVRVPTKPVAGPIDICGAGDAFTAAFILGIAAGATPEEAAGLGNASARYSVQQIGRTGNPKAEDLLAQL